MDMDIVEVPNNVNSIAVPTNMLSFRIGKKNDTYILVIMKRRPFIDIGCRTRRRCIIAVDLIPSGAVKLEQIEPEPIHFGGTVAKPPLMLARQLNHGLFKIAIPHSWAVDELQKGELLSTFVIIEKPQYLVFERVSNNEFRLTNKEAETTIVVYNYELDSRVECADIEVLETDLLSHNVCITCCRTRSIASLVGIGREGQKIRIRQTNAYYREKLPDIEKTLIIRDGKLVETAGIEDMNIL